MTVISEVGVREIPAGGQTLAGLLRDIGLSEDSMVLLNGVRASSSAREAALKEKDQVVIVERGLQSG